MIFSGTEDRDALDFFALALKQNLARMEEREAAANVDPPAAQVRCQSPAALSFAVTGYLVLFMS